jgi:uncharacterized protein YdhG (YjbR/CyaY superfamily)
MDRFEGKSINEYIRRFPSKTQKMLREMRSVIRSAAPEAGETVSYGIPTFTLNGNLVHFAAHKNHIGFYPTPSGIAAFRKELAGYESAKGTVRFPLDEPLPLPLIRRIVVFRVAEQLKKGRLKRRSSQ